MKISKLTKKEEEIMSILWDSDKPMSANDIMNASNGICLNTVQQTLHKLLKINYIHISNIELNKKSLTRLFRPSIDEADYFSFFINKSAFAKLASNFIKQSDNEETLKELSNLIAKKRAELKG
ncbi:BlaI/MecI/CopY family transcriptional regulator [Ligilactobacillus sp. Marseille-Q7487]|jgi:BlaI family penicillinase repressor|uniref:BlaI/MecI/CopY family transcriptional regulator n=1 Tax=Ligilactobacillus sp. Marseille-Q7487 TaxID=3022128 RepID=UPI0024A9E39A|nr:BlaI/MecI/CopY family transcriptional regulator [Ligilactobacillus sp. Marseille-Q7487]